MIDTYYILAEGIPAPLVFMGIFVVLWLLGKVFGSAEQNKEQERGSTGTTFDPRDLQKIRERMRDAGQADPAEGQRSAKRPKNRQRKAAAPTVIPVPPVLRPSVAEIAPALPSVAATILRRNPPSETGRKVKQLLQPNSLREAFLISEVLGKPVALREE